MVVRHGRYVHPGWSERSFRIGGVVARYGRNGRLEIAGWLLGEGGGLAEWSLGLLVFDL